MCGWGDGVVNHRLPTPKAVEQPSAQVQVALPYSKAVTREGDELHRTKTNTHPYPTLPQRRVTRDAHTHLIIMIIVIIMVIIILWRRKVAQNLPATPKRGCASGKERTGNGPSVLCRHLHTNSTTRRRADANASSDATAPVSMTHAVSVS